MCGIAGLLAADLSASERLALVHAMMDQQRHRGPSGEAAAGAGDCTLGIVRLAIVAHREATRVLADEHGRILGVANGEIYNHAELLRWLRERGHPVPDGPDTALLPYLYAEMGADFPSRVDGMFAVALWDRFTRTLVLARDRAGEKPLFYARQGRRIAFASEPGALLRLPWIARTPDAEALSRYLVHGFFAGADSAYHDVVQLPPAHVLVLHDETKVRLQRYWRPWDAVQAGTPQPRLEDGPQQVRAALASAVRSRVPSGRPFGVFLSGGVDSGLVAALCHAAAGPGFPTFSMAIDHRGYDESSFAKRVATALGTQHYEIHMGAQQGEEALDAWASRMDQPLGDPSVLPTWALARLAAAHVPVVLTGEGGDELFAGYPTYLGHRWAGMATHVPGALATAGVALARRFRPRHRHMTIAHLIERFLGVRGLSPFERHIAWFGTARAADALALLSPELRAAVDPASPLGHVARVAHDLGAAGLLQSGSRPPVLAYQMLDFETYLSGDLLTKVDRCTMAHGLESRAPFLRHSLVELAYGLPEPARIRGLTTKWALKEAARGLLPADVLARRKQGFSPPFSAWSRGPLCGEVTARLSFERVRRAGVLDPAVVARVWAEHRSGREDRGRTLWTILSLQCWAEHWLHGAAAPAPASRADRRGGVAALEAGAAPPREPDGVTPSAG